MSRWVIPWAIVLFTASITICHAEPGCDPAVNSILDCWHKHIPEVGRASPKAASEASASLADLVTAVDRAGGSSGSALTNFLPLLALSGFGGDLSGGSDVEKTDDDLGIDVNLPFFGSGGANALKLQAVAARRPVVYAPLLEAVGEADRDAFKNAAESDLGLGDDVRVSVAYNLVTDRWGRDFRRHRYLFDRLFIAATRGVEPPDFPFVELFKQIQAQDLIAKADRDKGSDLLSKPFREYSSIPTPAQQQQIMDLVEQAALAEASFLSAEGSALTEWRVLDFHKLVDNQPQLFFGGSIKQRKEVVGPDEASFVVRFEYPVGGNLNGLLRGMKNPDGTPCAIGGVAQFKDAGACLNSYASYISRLNQIQASAPRLAFSLEYVDVDAYGVSFAEPIPVSFDRDGSSKFISAASFGMRFQNDGVLDNSRLDISFRYEDVSDDPDRNDRSILSATWTKKTGTISIPLSLVYSNSPEFIDQEGLDDRLAANIGLRYEFNRTE